MASVSTGRLNSLIERLFHKRAHEHVIFDILKVEYPAVRILAEACPPPAAKADEAWLGRVELRRTDDVIALLESSGFVAERGNLIAAFLDERCGFIESHLIGNAAEIEPDQAVAIILRFASACHASGILLATNDLEGKVAKTVNHRKLSLELRRKGDAVETFLLDHFVLTPGGWKRMFKLQPGDF